MRLDKKVCLITGAGGGLGAEAARIFAKEGARVIVTDISEGAVAHVANEIGGTYFLHDVSSESDWQKITAATIEKFGHVDVLVNCAGIEGDFQNGGGLATSLAEWRRVMSVNLDGTFLGCKTLMPEMLARGRGSIVNVSSIVSTMGTPTPIAYGASKAGVQQLTLSLALIGASNGGRVRCNSVHPGVIKTRMTDGIVSKISEAQNITETEVEEMLWGGIPFKGRGRPIDIAFLITFLASDESAYITGSAFQADGGWHIVSAG